MTELSDHASRLEGAYEHLATKAENPMFPLANRCRSCCSFPTTKAALLPDDLYVGHGLILAPSSSEPERTRGYGAGDRVFFFR